MDLDEAITLKSVGSLTTSGIATLALTIFVVREIGM
jgi:hypothetical protein